MQSEGASGQLDSLYGPGSMLGWYLMILACVVSWTIHPKRSHKDSIDADLVVTLTFPVFAVGQLIYLARHASSLPPREEIGMTTPSTVRQRAIAMVTAIPAPLVVVEAFMNLAVLMVIIAAFRVHVRRGMAIAAVGLLTYSADWYLHMSNVGRGGYMWIFSRSFIANSFAALVYSATLLCSLGIAGIVILPFIWKERSKKPRIRNGSNSREPLLDEDDYFRHTLADMESTSGAVWSGYITILVMLLTLLTPIVSMMDIITGKQPRVPVPAFDKMDVAWFFPHTSSSLSNLDQTLAVLAGGTVLAFNIYTSVKIRYDEHKKRARREAEIRVRNSARMRRLLRHYEDSETGQPSANGRQQAVR